MGWLGRKRAKAQMKAALGEFELPSFPGTVLDALAALRDPCLTMSEIADRLAADPGLCARVLSVAGSTAYALRHPVRDVGHAVALLGRGEVEALVLSVAVPRLLPDQPTPSFDSSRFWRASARRATTAKRLAEVLEPGRKAEAFTASLLQDMAVPLLAQVHGESYAKLLEAWRHDGGDLAKRELDQLGFDHATIGGSVGEKWGFPPGLVAALGDHHTIDAGEVPTSVRLVASLGEGDPGSEREVLVETAKSSFGIGSDKVADIVDEGMALGDELAARMAAA
ncbi:MAG: HDOD domain-containing protein [Myxococcota bacterium]